MAKAKITVRAVVYETYEIDVPDDIMEHNEVEDYFLNIDDQSRYLIDKDSFSWEIDDIEIVNGE
jgi:hypothetical protein